MRTRCCKVDDIFFWWEIETTHKDWCTQYSVTSTNVKLSSWKSDRTSMTLLPTQQKKKNWNRQNESATRWRALKLFNQGGIMRIPKYGCHNLASPLLSFWSLRIAFISCCPPSWRSFYFRCVVVDPCFIHYHIPTQKILFTSLEQH